MYSENVFVFFCLLLEVFLCRHGDDFCLFFTVRSALERRRCGRTELFRVAQAGGRPQYNSNKTAFCMHCAIARTHTQQRLCMVLTVVACASCILFKLSLGEGVLRSISCCCRLRRLVNLASIRRLRHVAGQSLRCPLREGRY